MVRLLVLSLVISFTANLLAQDPKEYSSFEKEIIFEDNFVDNRNEWPTFYNKIKKGRYVVETIGKDSPAYATIHVDLDETNNYEIEAVVSMEWNKSKDFMGIVWNRNADSKFSLGFNKNLVTQFYSKQETLTQIQSNTKYSELLHSMFQKNTLTIRKVNDQFFLFINKIHVKTLDFNGDFESHIGFFVGKSSELRIYRLTVSYLD